MYPLAELKLSQLTEKLIMLLALVTAHRKQTLSLIKVSQMRKTTEGYEIRIPDKIKTSRPGLNQPVLILPTVDKKPELCVVRTLECHLELTKDLRGKTDSLLITTKKPYRAASKDTLSRWLRVFMAKCGISKEFAPHSIRHASTSAALKNGVDLKIIKNLAGWSETSDVFNKFYNRPIVKKKIFANAVLDN